MARPEKENIDFFSHDVTSGKTLFTLENKFGNDGYAFWFKLLELLGTEKGLFYNCNNDEAWLYMVNRARVDENKAKEILSLLARLDAIDKELWECGIIWSQNFVNRLDSLYKRRKTPKPEKPEFGVDVAITPVNATITPVNVCNNDQSKVEESIVKQSIEPPLPPLQGGTARTDSAKSEANGNPEGESLAVETAAGAQEESADRSKTPKDKLTKKQRELFERFYAAYPKKRSRGEAEKAWKSIKADDGLLDAIIRAIDREKDSHMWRKEGGQFIPYPASWLRAKGWENEPAPEPPKLSHEGREVRDLGIDC
jgi:hypothetical protein